MNGQLPDTLTEQELFDRVVTHLLKQGVRSKQEVKKPSGSTYTECMYRGPCDLKCAIGVLIRDDEYSPELEGDVFNLLNNYHTPSSLVERLTMHVPFLEILQSVHDSVDPSNWAEELRAIANQNSLIFNLPIQNKV